MGDAETSVTAKVLGSWLNCTTKSIRELAERGVVERSGRGRYPLKDSVRRYADYMRKVVTGRGEGTAAAERARLARAQAEAVEQKNARLAGTLVDADAVQREWNTILAGVRARLLAVPARVQQLAPHLMRSDLDAIDHEIREALEELATDAHRDDHREPDAPASHRPRRAAAAAAPAALAMD